MQKKITKFLLIGSLALHVGCEDLVHVSPPTTALTDESIFQSDATAIAFVTGLYGSLNYWPIYSPSYGFQTLGVAGGLSADELSLWEGAMNSASPLQIQHFHHYVNDLASSPELSAGEGFWGSLYPLVYSCNQGIAQLRSQTGLSPSVSQQLLGELLFVRGFLYFYLTNLYGEVPLVLTTDHRENMLLSRSAVPRVYEQIFTDLSEARELLSADYLDATLLRNTPHRLRPTRWAATALLARVSLYRGEWGAAEAYASEVIDHRLLLDTVPLQEVFLANSKEAIWQLQPLESGWNTQIARLLVIPETGFSEANYSTLYLNPSLFEGFADNDRRKTDWVGIRSLDGVEFPYANKYKSANMNAPVTEYTMVLRLGEQYLIRAEARARLGRVTGEHSAAADLAVIRKRAGLPGVSVSTEQHMLEAIGQERRWEMFTEFADRWFDLKRTGQIDAVMRVATPQKHQGAVWRSHQQLYPLPFFDVENAPNITQNLGY